jgi:hypothetical protein
MIELRKKGYTHQMIMAELKLKPKNYLKHYYKITDNFVEELKNKNQNDVAEAVKLAEIRLNEIYQKAVDTTLQDDSASQFVKIKAGELGMTVIQNLLKIQYDGNKLFKVLTKGIDANQKQMTGQDQQKALGN